MDSHSSSAARVGIVIFAAMLLVIAGVYLVGDGGGIFKDYLKYRALFPTTAGLRPDARVFLNGVQAGRVIDLAFARVNNRETIQVTLAIQSRFRELLGADSAAWIQSEGLLGDKSVWVTIRGEGAPVLAPGGTIDARERPLMHELMGTQLAAGTSDLLENLIALLKQVNAGEGTIGKLIKNPELYQELTQLARGLSLTVGELSGIAGDLKGMLKDVHDQKGTLGKLIASEEYAREFEKALGGANRLIDSLNQTVEPMARGEGTAGRILRDDHLYREIESLAAKVDSAAGKLERVLDALAENRSVAGRLIADREMGMRFDRTLASIEEILGKINRGGGLAGAIVNDPSLVESLQNLFLGVKESHLLLSVARRAEAKGREIEISRRRAAGESGGESDRDRRGIPPAVPGKTPEDAGKPIPAAGPAEGSSPAPPPAEKQSTDAPQAQKGAQPSGTGPSTTAPSTIVPSETVAK